MRGDRTLRDLKLKENIEKIKKLKKKNKNARDIVLKMRHMAQQQQN